MSTIQDRVERMERLGADVDRRLRRAAAKLRLAAAKMRASKS